jgi:hypothetical protein
MIATKTENPGPICKIKKTRPPQPPEPPSGGSAANWNEAARRAVALRLMEHLDDGVELAAELCNDPSFRSPDDRVTAVLAVARIVSAHAHLGRALATFTQAEQRRRLIVERIEPSQVWNDSKSIQEAELIHGITEKMFRYMKAVADETFDPTIKEAEEKANAVSDKADGTSDTPA